MELQLGLALPTNLPDDHDVDLDLNSRAYYYDPNNKPHDLISSDSTTLFNHKKRSISQLYHFVVDDDDKKEDEEVITALPITTTLPLLPLTPNHDIIITQQHPTNCSSTTILTMSDENDDDEDDVVEGPVGWPPVNSWRKRLCYDHNYYYEEDNIAAGRSRNNNNNIDQTRVGIHHGSVGCRVTGSNNNKRVYVKVKMEGVGIARKVDLSLHHSFHTLNQTLFHMFGHDRFSKCYQLAYQDQEGDWLLAEDVPWRSFIQCAQRLKLLKNSG